MQWHGGTSLLNWGIIGFAVVPHENVGAVWVQEDKNRGKQKRLSANMTLSL
jgi:hypothetical protein